MRLGFRLRRVDMIEVRGKLCWQLSRLNWKPRVELTFTLIVIGCDCCREALKGVDRR